MAGNDMPDDADKTSRGEPPREVADSELARRHERLTRALAEKRPGRGADGDGADRSGMAMAMKLSSEFVAAILVGAAIGWLIDKVAGTVPWGLVVFLLLGFCAGVVNVLRAAGMLAEQTARRDGAKAPDDR